MLHTHRSTDKVMLLGKERWWEWDSDNVRYIDWCFFWMVGLLHPDPTKRTTIASIHVSMFGPGADASYCRRVPVAPSTTLSQAWTDEISMTCHDLNFDSPRYVRFSYYCESAIATRYSTNQPNQPTGDARRYPDRCPMVHKMALELATRIQQLHVQQLHVQQLHGRMVPDACVKTHARACVMIAHTIVNHAHVSVFDDTANAMMNILGALHFDIL